MKIAYFDCFAGISGDMTLGALVDAGADFDALKSTLGKLGVHGYEILREQVTRRGIAATQITVNLHHHHDHDPGHGHHGRSYTEIVEIIRSSDLSERVRKQSIDIFTRLGEAEAKVHGTDIDSIHFHEVGAVDAIVDIVGACIGLEMLGIERVHCSAMPTFHGTVESAHGTLPLPAPATRELLKGVPWREVGIEGELVTPTGAAIVATLAEDYGPMPAMAVDCIGYGAGTKDFGIPNVLGVMVGEAAESSGEKTDVSIIETNIDDMNPQLYEAAMERLFAAGALDVYLTPIHMKKNRLGVLLSVICDPAHIAKMTDVIFEETSSIGVRVGSASRVCLHREIAHVDTPYGPIKIKLARRAGRIDNAQPEYDDCKAAAARHSVPVKAVQDAALVAYWSSESVQSCGNPPR